MRLVAKMMSHEKFVYCCLIFISIIAYGSFEIVDIEQGRINGTLLKSRYGEDFHAFLRIPFAEPPIGDLRFKEPQPPKPWIGIYDATYYGPMCVQTNARPDIGADENCLHLNVFSPNLNGSLPVIVYIFGGAFSWGTGIDQGGPQSLMDREVVVVNFNHRVSALGFLALGTREISGNAGMKDQVLALKWIQKNIALFGGDPNRVTLSGMSAGGISATAHMISPMSKDLFHGVYSFSGSITGVRSLFYGPHHLAYGKLLAQKIGCNDTENIENMVACLREKPAIEIVSTEVREYPECVLSAWFPIIEPNLGQEQFLADDPAELFRTGNFYKVPVVIGRSIDEFVNPVIRVFESRLLGMMNNDFDSIAPICFRYEENTDKSKAFSKVLRKTYLPFDTIDIRSFGGLGYLFGDSLIGYSVHRLVHLISDQTPVFYYKFSYIGRHSAFLYPHDKPYGTHHGDDTQYPFQDSTFRPGREITLSDPESFMVDRMTKIFESFAATGNPNFDLEEMNWPQHALSTEFYMDIGTHLVEKNGLFLERYTIWDEFTNSASSSVISKQTFVFLFTIFGFLVTFLKI